MTFPVKHLNFRPHFDLPLILSSSSSLSSSPIFEFFFHFLQSSTYSPFATE